MMYLIEKFVDMLIDNGIMKYGKYKNRAELINIITEFDSVFIGSVMDNNSFYSYLIDKANVQELYSILFEDGADFNEEKFLHFIGKHTDDFCNRIDEKGITIDKAVLEKCVSNYYERFICRIAIKIYESLSNNSKNLVTLENLKRIKETVTLDEIKLDSLDVKRLSQFFDEVVRKNNTETTDLKMFINELMSNSFKHGNASFVQVCLKDNSIILSDDGQKFNFLEYENSTEKTFSGGLVHLQILKGHNHNIDISYNHVDNLNYYIFKFKNSNMFIVNECCQLHFPSDDNQNEGLYEYGLKKNISVPDHCHELSVFIKEEYAFVSALTIICNKVLFALMNNENSDSIQKISFIVDSSGSGRDFITKELEHILESTFKSKIDCQIQVIWRL